MKNIWQDEQVATDIFHNRYIWGKRFLRLLIILSLILVVVIAGCRNVPNIVLSTPSLPTPPTPVVQSTIITPTSMQTRKNHTFSPTPTPIEKITATPTPNQTPTYATKSPTSPIESKPLIASSTPLPLTPEPDDGIELTSIIGSILSNPIDYTGQEVNIIGYYRGWDLLGEIGTGPPVTRNDWVITDASGAIYVQAQNSRAQPQDLDPGSRDDTTAVLDLVGVVRIINGDQPIIEPQIIEVIMH